jgi:hypothetical protein
MRICLLILVAGVLLCVPFGCNRGSDDDPVAYERDVDGPPVSIKTPMRDYEIIGKPRVVAKRRMALQAGIVDDAPPADAPADDDGDAAPADGDAAPADGDADPADADADPADADATPAPADGL